LEIGEFVHTLGGIDRIFVLCQAVILSPAYQVWQSGHFNFLVLL